ncbi:MAG: glycosyltransferase family 2 protein [Candidatus Pacebacteria bacterium]|nr:glycosyltransferase family 2 protein [Candidatus Paceibacterota bacterium]MDD5356595.1 glycosyltransferase family 2 protein [Candidatus Paceibacterota bacterium]
MKEFSLSVFFPAHNEEGNIKETLLDAIKTIDSIPEIRKSEVIVIDDGSTDKTAEIVREVMVREPRVRLISHEKNMGYGSALQSGIKSSALEYVFFTDADLQFYMEEIKRLIPFIPAYDVVIGYREKRMDHFMRLVNAKGWNILNRVMFGLKVKDIDCAFKLFRRMALEDITITSHGAMISAEILIKLKQKGYKIKEVAVSHRMRMRGKMSGAKPSVIVKAFMELIQLFRSGELKDAPKK